MASGSRRWRGSDPQPDQSALPIQAVTVKATTHSQMHLWDALLKLKNKHSCKFGLKVQAAVNAVREYDQRLKTNKNACHMQTKEFWNSISGLLIEHLMQPGIKCFRCGSPASPQDPLAVLGKYCVAAQQVGDCREYLHILASHYDQESKMYITWLPPRAGENESQERADQWARGDEELWAAEPSRGKYFSVSQNMIRRAAVPRQYFKGQFVIARRARLFEGEAYRSTDSINALDLLDAHAWSSNYYPAQVVGSVKRTMESGDIITVDGLLLVQFTADDARSAPEEVHILDVSLPPSDGEPTDEELKNLKKARRNREKELKSMPQREAQAAWLDDARRATKADVNSRPLPRPPVSHTPKWNILPIAVEDAILTSASDARNIEVSQSRTQMTPAPTGMNESAPTEIKSIPQSDVMASHHPVVKEERTQPEVVLASLPKLQSQIQIDSLELVLPPPAVSVVNLAAVSPSLPAPLPSPVTQPSEQTTQVSSQNNELPTPASEIEKNHLASEEEPPLETPDSPSPEELDEEMSRWRSILGLIPKRTASQKYAIDAQSFESTQDNTLVAESSENKRPISFRLGLNRGVKRLRVK